MTHAPEVRRFVAEHEEEVLADLSLLVGLETPSDRPDLLRPALDRIEAWLDERLGTPQRRVRHDGGQRGDVLDLTWSGTADGAVLSLCHYDTVWPEGTLAAWPLTRDGDVLSGPGVLDMKAGIVQTVWMLLALRALGAPHPALRLVLTGDEETGSLASSAHLSAAAAEVDLTLVSEPSAAGAAKVQRKGIMIVDLVVTGVEAHAGLDPDAGASAVHELALLVPQVVALADRERGTTVNVGMVQGGTGRNVAAGSARALVDVRIQEDGEMDRLERDLRALRVTDPRTTLEVVVDRNRPPMNPNPATEAHLAVLAEVAAELGEDVGLVPVGGASDANFVAALGLPVIDGLGGIGAGPHARHEHVLVSGLPRQTALMAGLAERVATANDHEGGLR